MITYETENTVIYWRKITVLFCTVRKITVLFGTVRKITVFFCTMEKIVDCCAHCFLLPLKMT